MDLAKALERISALEGEVNRLHALVEVLRDNSIELAGTLPKDTSPQNIRRKLWFDFCKRYEVRVKNPIPLFHVNKSNEVQTLQIGKDNRQVLKRSPAMDELFLREVNKIIDDYNKQTKRYEGLLYMMYKLSIEGPVPLYIGKTEKFGKEGNNLSTNIAGIKTGTTHHFARWGYNYAYHMGDLSAVVLNHAKDKRTIKYQNWAEALFKEPHSSLILKEPVFIWAQAWSRAPLSVLPQLGPVKLTFLEYILIGIASAEFPELLNEEGTNRE